MGREIIHASRSHWLDPNSNPRPETGNYLQGESIQHLENGIKHFSINRSEQHPVLHATRPHVNGSENLEHGKPLIVLSGILDKGRESAIDELKDHLANQLMNTYPNRHTGSRGAVPEIVVANDLSMIKQKTLEEKFVSGDYNALLIFNSDESAVGRPRIQDYCIQASCKGEEKTRHWALRDILNNRKSKTQPFFLGLFDARLKYEPQHFKDLVLEAFTNDVDAFKNCNFIFPLATWNDRQRYCFELAGIIEFIVKICDEFESTTELLSSCQSEIHSRVEKNGADPILSAVANTSMLYVPYSFVKQEKQPAMRNRTPSQGSNIMTKIPEIDEILNTDRTIFNADDCYKLQQVSKGITIKGLNYFNQIAQHDSIERELFSLAVALRHSYFLEVEHNFKTLDEDILLAIYDVYRAGGSNPFIKQLFTHGKNAAEASEGNILKYLAKAADPNSHELSFSLTNSTSNDSETMKTLGNLATHYLHILEKNEGIDDETCFQNFHKFIDDIKNSQSIEELRKNEVYNCSGLPPPHLALILDVEFANILKNIYQKSATNHGGTTNSTGLDYPAEAISTLFHGQSTPKTIKKSTYNGVMEALMKYSDRYFPENDSAPLGGSLRIHNSILKGDKSQKKWLDELRTALEKISSTTGGE